MANPKTEFLAGLVGLVAALVLVMRLTAIVRLPGWIKLRTGQSFQPGCGRKEMAGVAG